MSANANVAHEIIVILKLLDTGNLSDHRPHNAPVLTGGCPLFCRAMCRGLTWEVLSVYIFPVIKNSEFWSLGWTSQSNAGFSALPSGVTSSAPPASASNHGAAFPLSALAVGHPFAFRTENFSLISTKMIDLSVPPVSQKIWDTFNPAICDSAGLAPFGQCLKDLYGRNLHIFQCTTRCRFLASLARDPFWARSLTVPLSMVGRPLLGGVLFAGSPVSVL